MRQKEWAMTASIRLPHCAIAVSFSMSCQRLASSSKSQAAQARISYARNLPSLVFQSSLHMFARVIGGPGFASSAIPINHAALDRPACPPGGRCKPSAAIDCQRSKSGR
jgi:hypothetical protein